jgi:hypothetical protein
MEPSYMILGGDGKQYGPVSAEQFRGWIADGRVNGATQVWRSGTDSWVPASSIPELGSAPVVSAAAPIAVAAVPPLSGAATPAADPALLQQVKNGTSWFYWIGGLSLINSFAALTGAGWRFFIGLGITQIVEELALKDSSRVGTIIAVVFALLAAGALISFGILGSKGHGWAMLVGAILLAFDGLLVGFLAVSGGGSSLWISFAFHAWAIFMIWRGFLAIRQMKR